MAADKLIICGHNCFTKIDMADYNDLHSYRIVMSKNIIGRNEELQLLGEIAKSKEPEFVAVYGRRRVGKTFLIREVFSNKGIYLEATGTKDAPMENQLENFMSSISKTFAGGRPLKVPSTWEEAFSLLTNELQLVPKSKKITIFFDELPWLSTKRSRLIQALDYYWNAHWSKQNNLTLIVCGSAASWMLDNLIQAKGGLYNRLTRRILLEPFNLKETKEFLESRSLKLSQKEVLDLYMAIGGIPFYLKGVKKGKSSAQMIDDLCFKKSGLLHSEFQNLFKALFDQAETNVAIVRAIEKAHNSISRKQLIKTLGKSSGGTLNKRLEELEASNFIQCFIPYGKKKKDRFYRITDEYTLFYIKWIEPLVSSGVYAENKGHWKKIYPTPPRLTWAGYAFESVCLKHLPQIIKALDLENTSFKAGSWRFIPRKGSQARGAQIDLLFDRDDNAITICEIKYSDSLFTIDRAYSKNLTQKMDVFEEQRDKKKQLFLAMITTKGVKKNLWSEDLVDMDVKLDDLFL